MVDVLSQNPLTDNNVSKTNSIVTKICVIFCLKSEDNCYLIPKRSSPFAKWYSDYPIRLFIIAEGYFYYPIWQFTFEKGCFYYQIRQFTFAKGYFYYQIWLFTFEKGCFYHQIWQFTFAKSICWAKQGFALLKWDICWAKQGFTLLKWDICWAKLGKSQMQRVICFWKQVHAILRKGFGLASDGTWRLIIQKMFIKKIVIGMTARKIKFTLGNPICRPIVWRELKSYG